MLDDMAYESRIGALRQGVAAETRDQGVWPGADGVEDDEAPFSISELMILLITNSC
jgi:hypothetical protein